MNHAAHIPMRIKCRAIPADCGDYLTMKAFCERYYYSPTQVRRLIVKRRFKAFKFRGKWYVKPPDFDPAAVR